MATELGDTHPRVKVLVIGAVHGNERAGTAIARRLAAGPAVRGASLWVVRNANPDGSALGTRQNARGVDLNRNFPYLWRSLERRGGLHYSGQGPASEPETRVIRDLINTLRPRITIWYHQPLDVVDLSGGNPGLAYRYGRFSTTQVVRLNRYPGSATGWQNHHLPGTTAFVVELPSGKLSPSAVARHTQAVRRLVDSISSTA